MVRLLTLILVLASADVAAGSSGVGGIPGFSGRLPPIGPPPALRGPSPSATPVQPRAAQGVPLGLTPLEQSLRTPAPRPDAGRGVDATQRAVDELMEALGVERLPSNEPPAGVRCAQWDRNLRTCLDRAGPRPKR